MFVYGRYFEIFDSLIWNDLCKIDRYKYLRWLLTTFYVYTCASFISINDTTVSFIKTCSKYSLLLLTRDDKIRKGRPEVLENMYALFDWLILSRKIIVKGKSHVNVIYLANCGPKLN